MTTIKGKQYRELINALETNLAVDFFEDDEIDYILTEIECYDIQIRQKVLALALSFSDASSSLVPGLLGHIRTASARLSTGELDRWVSRAFDLRDGTGLEAALLFLARVGPQDLAQFASQEGLNLRDVAPLLETYVRAMSGRELTIVADKEAFTDTETIHLPAALNRFSRAEDNFSLYKLSAAFAWAEIALGTLTPDADLAPIASRFFSPAPDRPDLVALFHSFPEKQLALDLYTVIESFRIEYFLMRELPGLMKQAAGIKHALYQERKTLAELSEKTAFVEGLWQYYLAGRIKGGRAQKLIAAASLLIGNQYEPGPWISLDLLFDFYDVASRLPGVYEPRPLPCYVGKIDPERIAEQLERKRAAYRRNIEAFINQLMHLPDLVPGERGTGVPSQNPSVNPQREYLLIKGRLLELDEDLKQVIEDKGKIPGGILVTGSEMGGESGLVLVDLHEEQAEIETAGEGIRYDEWDYKRMGYRKGWCSLTEQEIHPGSEPFVELTLKRYGSSVVLLRKKFELLRRERGIKRRQRDGDDIDLDALIESFADIHAGISPSENLFSRIERQERSIAVLFLVDMSGSTRGWVNRAEKEALVLLSEALETLGDRYAVYGFSSMTRNRCELYRIKGFHEAYGGRVKRRIAGIEPKDYTRMGPFIRHAAMLLGTVEAKTRLLITLTDSKPEDWDGYKGDYGIEDTRMALIETTRQGIHPFCITIDREAQSYLPHLFGPAHYIFINDVRKLPNRITEIYRKLTT